MVPQRKLIGSEIRLSTGMQALVCIEFHPHVFLLFHLVQLQLVLLLR